MPLSRLLGSLPSHTGMAFVLPQHLDLKHPSLLTQLLSTKTTMPVTEATDGVPVAADHVYVVPPAADLLIEEGRLKLTPRELDAQAHLSSRAPPCLSRSRRHPETRSGTVSLSVL